MDQKMENLRERALRVVTAEHQRKTLATSERVITTPACRQPLKSAGRLGHPTHSGWPEQAFSKMNDRLRVTRYRTQFRNFSERENAIAALLF